MAISDLDYTDDSDVALIRRTRTGDTDAYARLHQRHVGPARALAWRMSRSAADADDLVSEGFARVLAALQRGNGPDTAFRPYLLSTIRRLAYDRTDRERRESPVEHEVEEGRITDDPVLAGFERQTAAAAFASLPERWRMVLWHTEVEGESPAEVAVMLGMKPNAVAALAYRAREGLRQAYLSHHAGPEHELSPECRHTADRLAAHVRGGLVPAQQQRVSDHLEGCERCQAAYLELATVNTSLRAILAPVVLGPVAGAAYLAEVSATTASPAGGGAVGVALGGRSVVRGIRRAVGSPARAAIAAGAAAAVAVSVGLVAGRGGPVQDVAAARPAAPSVTSTSPAAPPPVPDTEPRVLTAGVTAPDASPVAVPEQPSPSPVARPVAVPQAPPGATAPASPTSSVPAATTVPPTTVPPTTAPPTTVPSPTVPPTTVPPPTALPTTTTTTTTPPPPSELEVRVSSAGNVVAGRPGVLVAQVRNVGEGVGEQVRVELRLDGIALRGRPHRSAADGDAPAPRWDCTADDPARLVCTTTTLEPGATSSVYVPISAPAGGTAATVDAGVSGALDAAGPSAHSLLDLVVRPTGMAARFAAVERGDVSAAGNSLVTCPGDHEACAAAREGQGSLLDNGNFAMVPVDVDDDPTTANSSSASAGCAAGSTVLSATLYWGADLSPGEGGEPPVDPSAAGRAVVVSPTGVRSDVSAERVDALDTRYQAVADVTDLVASGGSGSWTVGGVQLATGENRYGGWALVVACAAPSAPVRSLVVLDGLAEVLAGDPVSLEVGGFSVPEAGSSAAAVATVTYEGDLGLEGDQLAVAGRAVVDALNPLGNTFNSTAAALGLPTEGSVPGSPNLFGFDVDRFDVTAALPPGATSTVLELSSTQDVYLPGVVAFSVDQ